MQLSPWIWLLQTMPESLAVTSLAMVLASRRLEAKNILLIGLLLAAAVFLVRLIPLSFGIHFILFIIILAVLLSVRLKLQFSRSLLTALIVCLILAVLETVFLSLFSSLSAVPFENIVENIPLHMLYAWPHIFLLFLSALVIDWWRKNHVKRESNLA
ncbi:MAG: hypothetical protein AB1767_10530 [Bacillota bacterium]